MKKIASILLFLVLIFVLSSCSGGSYVLLEGNITASSKEISGSYNSFNGNFFKKAKFKQDQTIDFHYSASTVSGELTANLYDSNGNQLLEINHDQPITINRSGTYKVEVVGKKHEGSFRIFWEVQN